MFNYLADITLPEFIDMIHRFYPDLIYNQKRDNKLFFTKIYSNGSSVSFSTNTIFSQLIIGDVFDKEVFLKEISTLQRKDKILKLKSKW